MTSKIYKPHINRKPKRPGTHQDHYLGPTVAVVAGKLDPTIGQLCFRRNFQTVRNLQKGTTEMSSEGPKMVERSYGGGLKWPEMAEKSRNARLPKVAAAAASPARSRRVRWRLAVKFGRRDRLDVLLPPVRGVYSDSGRWCLIWSNLPRLANGQNDPTRVHKFWRTSLGFWSSRWCFGD